MLWAICCCLWLAAALLHVSAILLAFDLLPFALQAAGEYRRYLADWWGDAIKAEFEERKHEAGCAVSAFVSGMSSASARRGARAFGAAVLP